MNNKSLFICLLMLTWMLTILPGKAQVEKPVLKNATVDEQGHVRLTWESQGDTLIISRDSIENKAMEGIKVVYDTTLRSWVDRNSGANTKPRAYRLSIYKEDEGSESNYFNTTHLSLEMDTCQKNIQLNWSRHIEIISSQIGSGFYRNFNDSLEIKEYRIWRSTNRQPPRQIATVVGDTSYTDTNIEYDHKYKYYVEGVVAFDTSIKSQSNRDSINIDMPDDPGYIHFESLKSGEKQTKLRFNISEDSQLNQYALLRSADLNGPYDTLETFNTNEYSLSYTDEEITPREDIYYYHLAAVNQCGALTTRSDTLSNLRLEVQKENMAALLGWNQWEHLNQTPVRFHIQRKIGNEPDFSFLRTTYNPPYRDTDIETFRGGNVSSEFCYTITAEIPAENRNMQVTSNTTCIYMKPSIFVPNAFTPNIDGTNDVFKPEFTFIPENYLFIVYNRSGMKVFESRDPEKPWRGRIQGGNKAPSGTYIWYLEVSNPGQQKIRKRGEITLIYP
jgi:gliding motility-associated-like protein